jgi:hypothetical protein
MEKLLNTSNFLLKSKLKVIGEFGHALVIVEMP